MKAFFVATLDLRIKKERLLGQIIAPNGAQLNWWLFYQATPYAGKLPLRVDIWS